jgi:hypothetical protein
LIVVKKSILATEYRCNTDMQIFEIIFLFVSY